MSKSSPKSLAKLDLDKHGDLSMEEYIDLIKQSSDREIQKFSTRITGDLQVRLEKEVRLAMEKTVSWIHRRMPEMIHLTALAEPKIDLNSCPIAATDGKTIYFGMGFLKFSATRKNRSQSGSLHTNMGDACFVVLHEFFHVAYSHPWRMLIAMQRSSKPFSHTLYNIVADVVINSKIMQIPYHPAKPDDNMGMFQEQFDKLLKEWQGKMPDEDLPDELVNIHKHPILKVHDALLTLPKAPKKEEEGQSGQPGSEGQGGNSQGQGQDSDQESENEGDGSGKSAKPGKGKGKGSGKSKSDGSSSSSSGQGGSGDEEMDPDEKFEDDVQSELERILGVESNDLKIPASGNYDENQKREQENRRALQRVADSCKARGVNPGNGILDQDDIDPVPYPWQRIIAPLLTRKLIRNPGIDYRRPSRSMISCAAAFPSQQIPFEAGYGDWTEGGRLAILIDTSGSIDDGTLKYFLGHMVTILQVIASPCDLIAGDTQVNLALENINLENNIAKTIQGKITGRGGTDFEPLLEKAKEFQADIALYLTDGYAPFPPQPQNMMMIWAVTADGLSPDQFPYGMVVTVQ